MRSVVVSMSNSFWECPAAFSHFAYALPTTTNPFDPYPVPSFENAW